MSLDEILLIVFLAVIFIIIAILLFYRPPKKVVTQSKDHDNIKKRHPSRRSAELAILRMRGQNLPGSERLNAYYNEKYDAWFVGKSKY